MLKIFWFLLTSWVMGHAQEFTIVKTEYLSPDLAQFDCHSSDIVETTPGCFCAVWKGGSGEGKSNIDMKENVGIWHSLYDGASWSYPHEIVKAEHSVCWTPVLCKLSEEELLLFFRIGKDPRTVVSFLKRSFDHGKTWSEEEILPAGINGPTKCAPLVLADGALLCPSSCAVGNPDEKHKATAIWFDLSPDKGIHWSKIGPLEIPGRKFGVIEPALFEDGRSNLRILCRDRAHKIGEKGYLWTAESQDQGVSWSELTPTHLPNPDSGIDTIDLGEGRIVLLYNHSHDNRYPLHLAISSNGGNSWSSPYVIDKTGEFPAGCISQAGQLHITYAISEGV